MRNEWKNELIIEVKKPSEADGLDSGNVAQLLETKFMDEMAEASGGVE